MAQVAETFHCLPSQIMERDAASTRFDIQAMRALLEYRDNVRRAQEAGIGALQAEVAAHVG